MEAAGYLLDDLVESVSDLVKVIETYKKMNSVSKTLTASLYRRRQEEAENAIDLAVNRLQVGKKGTTAISVLANRESRDNNKK